MWYTEPSKSLNLQKVQESPIRGGIIEENINDTHKWEAERMARNILVVDFDSIIPGIQAERYDVGAAGITITPDRQKNCDFSNPYFLANQVIVVNPGSDIQGKTIAVQTGTTAEEYCMDNGYSVLSFASNNDAQAALTSGKADAWVVDNEAAARMAADQSLTVLDEAMTSEPYAFAFAKGSSLVDQVNTALQELLQDGTVEKLFQEYDTVYVSPLS